MDTNLNEIIFTNLATRVRDNHLLLSLVKANTNSNIMSIDLGLDNLATLTFKENTESYIINGKTIKSKNSYFNKEIAKFQRIRMKQLGTSKVKDTK